MTYDPKLVEAVAERYWLEFETSAVTWDKAKRHFPDSVTRIRMMVRFHLDAIDAAVDERGNRIAWVAPWHASESMILAGREWRADPWPFMRDTCLAERRGEGMAAQEIADLKRALAAAEARIAEFMRLLVMCAKQSEGDEGAIPDMVAAAIGEAEFDRLYDDIADEEVHRAAYSSESDPEART